MILIVGCGFLGSHLLNHIVTQTNEPILATVRDIKNAPTITGVEYIQCDVTKKNDVEILANRCKNQSLTVFYFAACHYIDYVFENPQVAKKTNIDGLKKFISSFSNIEKLFFASTDCVYGENHETVSKFSENSDLSPINEYGKQKVEAETIVTNAGYTVLRLPFMLGPSLTLRPHFYDKICSSLSNNEMVEMIDGMHRSVLSYAQVASIIYALSKLDKLPPVINVCSDKAYSKYEMGCILAKKLNVSEELIIKITEEEGEKFFKDKRASCTVMDNTLLKDLLGIKTILWEEEKC